MKTINTRDPLITLQREAIIKASVTPEEFKKIRFVHVYDYLYNIDKWISGVTTGVHSCNLPWTGEPCEFYLVGMKKDYTSFYLNLFPNWKSLNVEPEDDIISSTDIRNEFYENFYVDYLSDNFVTGEAHKLFIEFMNRSMHLCLEYKHETEYPIIWGKGPHLTVDAVIVQAGYILLINRGREYGGNLYALPGGFVNPNEKTLDACLRELDEETSIKIPEKVLRGSLVKSKLYDDPHRSNRGRIVSNVFQFRLSDVGPLAKVKGGDDADNASWVPLSKLRGMRDLMFEDHWDLIDDMLKL